MRKLLRCILVSAATCSVIGSCQANGTSGNGSTTTQSELPAWSSSTAPVVIHTGVSVISNATCASRTANYITHTLPAQCLRRDRQHANATKTSGFGESSAADSSDAMSMRSLPSVTAVDSLPTESAVQHLSTFSQALSDGIATATASPSTTLSKDESEADSPLDNAKFLSFEEWKKQAIAKYPEQGANARERPDRQRPGINNALDGYGDDGEIELDFSGFGATSDKPKLHRTTEGDIKDIPVAQSAPNSPSARSKDAGKTCKERTNYASFDCAATMLKNNPECKSASSVLVENKDSYMLNTCSAKNKFFIVELCDLILVDTVVLANYEFFSSIFRHFRVSVSDTYPVKMEKWTELGTFEARNTREVQAFLIEHSKIWARYLRVEFLTHYGSEYYCPISLLRVHGTTMLEEIRAQEESASAESGDEVTPEVELPAGPPITPGSATSADESVRKTMSAVVTDTLDVKGDSDPSDSTTQTISSAASSTDSTLITALDRSEGPHTSASVTSSNEKSAARSTCKESASSAKKDNASGPNGIDSSAVRFDDRMSSEFSARQTTTTAELSSSSPSVESSLTNSSAISNNTSIGPRTTEDATPSKSSSIMKVSSGSSENHALSASPDAASSGSSNSSTSSRTVASTSTVPAPPQPSTQESFFKSIHKRLQQLESNSTLSLQYIEEQSRILRDAFSKVEKRQISATTSFLTNLNETVMNELRGFRQSYDQLWQSTVIELEGQREQYQREMLALSTRLTLVADELVWQKRMGIVQSTLLLLCLGLVLFARGGSTGYLEVPIMQQVMNRSSAALHRGGWESPPASPSPVSRSPVGLFRRKLWRSVTEPSAGNTVDDAMSGTDSRPQTREGTDLDGLMLDVKVEPPTPPRASESGDGTWNDSEEGEVETVEDE